MEDNQSTFITKLKYYFQTGLLQVIICILLVLFGWILSLFSMIPNYVVATIYAAAFLVGGYLKAKEGILKTIESKQLNIEMLMVTSALGSFIIGYWAEGAILILIFSLSGVLETYTEEKSRKEIMSLLSLQPEVATVISLGAETVVPVEKLKIGDLVIIKPGERVPIDGVVIEGSSLIDEASLTGESIPVEKVEKSDVYAGTMNLNKVLIVEVSKRSNETIFYKIIQLVHDTETMKAPTQVFIERFEYTYVKVVIAMVFILIFGTPLLLGWSWSEAFYRGMVLMAVASPCAVVASVSPAVLAAISHGAKKGILIKGGLHLDRLSMIKMLAFDKTGTLTVGKPSVTDIICLPTVEVDHFLYDVATIEKHSTHPLAQSVVNYATMKKGMELGVPLDVENVVGKGVHGRVGENNYLIGNVKMMNSSISSELQKLINEASLEGKTLVYVEKNSQIIGCIALQDRSRDNAKEMIRKLHEQKISATMITGDTELVAQQISEENGIDKYYAQCFPEEKLKIINQLMTEHKFVGMVGDGINDAPALTASYVGIAMGSGTDVALETADIVLMRDDLSCITDAIILSKRLKRIINQNLIFSVGVIILLVLLNVFQVLKLPVGVIGHEVSTLLVIINGLRLLK